MFNKTLTKSASRYKNRSNYFDWSKSWTAKKKKTAYLPSQIPTQILWHLSFLHQEPVDVNWAAPSLSNRLICADLPDF